MLVGGVSWCGRSILSIARRIPWTIGYSARGARCWRRETRLSGNAVFGARSLLSARIIMERDIKTWEQEILVLIWVPLKLFLFLNTCYLFPASARAILGKIRLVPVDATI